MRGCLSGGGEGERERMRGERGGVEREEEWRERGGVERERRSGERHQYFNTSAHADGSNMLRRAAGIRCFPLTETAVSAVLPLLLFY